MVKDLVWKLIAPVRLGMSKITHRDKPGVGWNPEDRNWSSHNYEREILTPRCCRRDWPPGGRNAPFIPSVSCQNRSRDTKNL